MLTLPPPAGPDATALARALGVTRTAAAVLLARGYREAERGTRFLEPKLAHLTAPDAMLDRAEAVARLAAATRSKERVCVFGDYDADGVTAAALVTDVLRALGADVVPVLASRFHGGYGLSAAALERVRDTGASLVVTCDCGSSDHERLDALRQAGIDTVVIDHHRVPDAPLPALAFLNPHRPGCGFPYKGLASVGLALSICAGVRTELAASIDLRRWLDLVAIGTIGDVAPLDGDNRPLVRAGLGALRQGTRPGTRALAEIAGCAAFTPSGEDVAFRLSPRINAPGRLGRPDLALSLLLATSDVEARALAGEMEQLSTKRKEIERGVLEEALRELEDPALRALPGIVLAKQGWHPGVVGIVAGRLVARFGKPTVVIALEGASGKGSARTPAGFSVYDALAASRDTLMGFGGHHAAAGVEVAVDRVSTFRDAFCAAVARVGIPTIERTYDADARLDPSEPPVRVVQDLLRFEPCGHSNPAPRVAIEGARVLSTKEVRGGHLKAWIDVGGQALSCFGPEMGSLAGALRDRAHLVGLLKPDTWAGGGAIELRLHAAEPANGSARST
jgi:single-stranded-DNA-specific exonuclease